MYEYIDSLDYTPIKNPCIWKMLCLSHSQNLGTLEDKLMKGPKHYLGAEEGRSN